MKKIAWIGTGVMGKPMALHLANAGYQIKAYNRSYDKAAALAPLVTPCQTIQEAVHDADIIFSIVGYPADVSEVYQSVFRYAPRGALCVDMTTSSPALAKQLAVTAEELGFVMVDAPVTGGDIGAINATLSIMVGGPIDAFDSLLPLFEKLGKRITYMGLAGAGQYAKLANQITIAGAIAGVAEALTFAQLKHLDLVSMLAVITGGSASSWQAQNNGPKMITHDYAPGFYIKHFLKDLNLAIAEKGDFPLPILENVQRIYDQLATLHRADEGTQAIIEYYLEQLENR